MTDRLSAIDLTTGNNPSLSRFYAEIEERASREATPEAGTIVQHEMTVREEHVRNENGNTEEIQVTRMDVVQVCLDEEKKGHCFQ